MGNNELVQVDIIRKLLPGSIVKIFQDRPVVRHRYTTAQRDRDNQEIPFEGWYNDGYMKRDKQSPTGVSGPFAWSHEYKDFLPIGKTIDLIGHPRLKAWDADVEYTPEDIDPFGWRCYKHVKWGSLKDTSVGFMCPYGIEDAFVRGDVEKGEPEITWLKKELLEISLCMIGSNPGVMTDLKSYLDEGKSHYTARTMIWLPKDITDPHDRVVAAIEQLKEPAIQLDTVAALHAYKDIKEDIITKPETTEDYHRIPVDSGDHKDHRIRTIDIDKGKGIKALYCGDCKKVITYLFDTDKWSVSDAKDWVKEHKTILTDQDRKHIILLQTNPIYRDNYLVKQLDDIKIKLASLEARLTDLGDPPIVEGEKTDQTGADSGEDGQGDLRTLLASVKAILKGESFNGESIADVLQAIEDASKQMRNRPKRKEVE